MSIQSFSDFVYSIKEKITDQEYMDVMNMLTQLNIKSEEDKRYKVVLLFPTVITDFDVTEGEHERPEEFNFTRHTIRNRKIEFTTKLVSCRKQKNNKGVGSIGMCHYCLCHPEKGECTRINFIKESRKKDFPSVDLNSILHVCDENVYDLVRHIERINIQDGMVQSLHTFEYEGDEEVDPDRERYNKRVSYDSIHFRTEVTIVSITEVN